MSVRPDTSATAAAGETPQRTFPEFLLSQNWDSAIQLTLETNSYYYDRAAALESTEGRSGVADGRNANKDEEGEATQRSGECPCTLAGLCQAVRRYFTHSSKTRLAVHGFTAAYLLYVVTHPSHNVPVVVSYDADKFSSAINNNSNNNNNKNGDGGNGNQFQRPCPVRLLRRVLRPLIFGAPASNKAAYDYTTLNHAEQTPMYVYQSREGMQLLTKEPITSGDTRAHTWMGCLLFPLSLLQLESVFHMSYTLAKRKAQAAFARTSIRDTQAEQSTQQQQQQQRARSDAAYDGAKNAREGHCTVGLITVGMMLGMAGMGLSLRHKSIFTSASGSSKALRLLRSCAVDFGRALFYFALPWGVFSAGLMGSALQRKAVPHAIIGTLVPKACLAVGLARFLGGALQRLLGVAVELPGTASPKKNGCPFHKLPTPSTEAPAAAAAAATAATPTSPPASEPLRVVQSVPGELERVYYVSIAAAAVLVGVWAVCDVVALLRRAHEVFEEQERKKRSA